MNDDLYFLINEELLSYKEEIIESYNIMTIDEFYTLYIDINYYLTLYSFRIRQIVELTNTELNINFQILQQIEENNNYSKWPTDLMFSLKRKHLNRRIKLGKLLN